MIYMLANSKYIHMHSDFWVEMAGRESTKIWHVYK